MNTLTLSIFYFFHLAGKAVFFFFLESLPACLPLYIYMLCDSKQKSTLIPFYFYIYIFFFSFFFFLLEYNMYFTNRFLLLNRLVFFFFYYYYSVWSKKCKIWFYKVGMVLSIRKCANREIKPPLPTGHRQDDIFFFFQTRTLLDQ